jgi:hypothetical protein
MSKKSNRGRPAYKPTAADRRKVTNAAAGGMSHEEIAIALGICRNTLEKCFEPELSRGALAKRMDYMDALSRTALAGNVAALKTVLALTPSFAAPPLESEAGSTAPKGKKEQANADAVTAAKGTDWADLLEAGANVTPIRKKA